MISLKTANQNESNLSLENKMITLEEKHIKNVHNITDISTAKPQSSINRTTTIIKFKKQDSQGGGYIVQQGKQEIDHFQFNSQESFIQQNQGTYSINIKQARNKLSQFEKIHSNQLPSLAKVNHSDIIPQLQQRNISLVVENMSNKTLPENTHQSNYKVASANYTKFANINNQSKFNQKKRRQNYNNAENSEKLYQLNHMKNLSIDIDQTEFKYTTQMTKNILDQEKELQDKPKIQLKYI